MGDKDITEKTLEAYNDVFADIVNVLLFKGKRVIKEDDLEDAVLRYHYKADDNKLHEMERDAAKYWLNSKLFPLQILVTGQLDQTLHGWLHSLTRTIQQESAENLLNNYSGLGDGRDKQNAGVIVDFVSNVNVEIFLRILKLGEISAFSFKYIKCF